MFKRIKYIVIAVITSTCFLSTAHANPWVIDAIYSAQPDEVELDPQVTSIEEGEPAPFDGVIMNAAAAAKISVDRDNAKAACQIEIDREVTVQRAELQLKIDNLHAANVAYIERLKLEERINGQQIKNLSVELERAQKQALNTHWSALYYVGGVATGVIMIVVGAYAVRGIRETNL